MIKNRFIVPCHNQNSPFLFHTFPCRKVSPIMEKLANEYEGELTIYKVNIDEEKNLAAAFQISSIPTVLFIPKDVLDRAT